MPTSSACPHRSAPRRPGLTTASAGRSSQSKRRTRRLPGTRACGRGVAGHRLEPKARVVDSMLIGVDPVTMLTGPHEVTPQLLRRNQLAMSDIELVEINEAFASIVLSWADVVDADLARVNPNGGAIALGHPLGATGAVLITKAVHELKRTNGRHALVTMWCGGGLGTRTLPERADGWRISRTVSTTA